VARRARDAAGASDIQRCCATGTELVSSTGRFGAA
jgi:hypothetical protein